MYNFYIKNVFLYRNGVPFPDAKLPDFNNKKDMESSLRSAGQWNKNDLSQVQEKFSDEHKEVNGTNNLQNGLLQYAANEIAKGKGENTNSGPNIKTT